MKKIIYILVIALVLVFCAKDGAWAIKEINKQPEIEENTQKVRILKVEYNDIVKKAEAHSYDLKSADFNILISKQGVVAARADYFPKIGLGASTEYTKNFRDGRDTTVMSIGDSFINPYTRFQSVLGVNLSYNLFDFGVRSNILKSAKEDVLVKEMEEKQRLQDVIINVTDTYAKLLMLNGQLIAFKEIEKLQVENLGYYERLYNAQLASSIELNTVRTALEQTRKQLYEVKSLKAETVNWLMFYTGEVYDEENLDAEAFAETEFNPFEDRDINKSAVYKLHEYKIKQKGYEVKAAKRLNYPKVTAYSRYYLYGSNHSSYKDSIGDIRPSNFSIGGSINMPVFDGFSNRANIKTKKLELEQLMNERDKAVSEHGMKVAVMRSNLNYLDNQIKSNALIEEELMKRVKSTERLASNRIVSPIELNNAKIEYLKQKIETVKNSASHDAIIRGIEVLTREY